MPKSRPAGGGGGGGTDSPAATAPVKAQAPADDALAAALHPSFQTASAAPPGISAPWKPASRSGGGAALPPRGGSGGGALPIASAMVQGRSPLPSASSAPATPPTIPGLFTGGSPTSPTPSFPAPVVTRNAAAGGLNGGAGSKGSIGLPAPVAGTGGFAPADSPSPTPSTFSSVLENPSSIPSSSSGGLAPLSFPYFPLYTVDANNGVVLFNGQSQQENLNGLTDLYAQVKGTAVSSYSWTATGSYTTAISGTSTYHLHLQWAGTNGTGANEIETVTLTVTDTNSHQETQTYYFVLPPSNAVTMPFSASWPVTLPPDLVEPGAPIIASQGVAVDATSGALDSTIPLPSYNPNVPAIALTYNWLTADPQPIIVVHHTLDDTQSIPTKVNATLTFNSVAGTTWYYNTSQFIPGDIQQIALQANATGLSTGRYSYSVQIVDERSTNTTSTYSGTATVLNQSTGAFGDGWTLQGLEQVTSATGGVILALGGNGEASGSRAAPASAATTPARPATSRR